MDIKLPLDANIQMAISKSGSAIVPELKLNQVLDAKIITNQQILNTLTVALAGKTVTLTSSQPLPLVPGQALQLQVVKLLPTPELKILAPPLPLNVANSTEPPLLKLLPASPPVTAPAPNTIPLANLTVGQQLSAQVLNVGEHSVTLQLSSTPAGMTTGDLPKNPATSQATVTLDTRQLQLDTSSKTVLVAGKQLDLQVIKDGEKPVFRATISQATTEQQIVTAFKQLLPIQNSASQVVAQLVHLLPGADSDKTVGETLKQLAEKILQNIPDKSRLFQPASLKQIIAESGLFMERKLTDNAAGASQSTVLQDDFKLKLSKLIAQLGVDIGKHSADSASPATKELLQETLQKAQGALARLTLDQLNSLPRDDAPKQVWLMELPFFNNNTPETLQLLIEHDKQADSESGQKNWVVSITITPPELATIHCKVSCYDGSVNTRFWSESTSTVDKINARLDYLRQQFEEKGLKPGFMDVQQGKPTLPNPQSLPPQNLLSEKV